MTRVEGSVMIDRSTDAVWSLISDMDKFEKTINPYVIESKQTSAGPIGVGATFHEVRSKSPKAMDYRFTEYEPNNRLALEVTSGMLRGSIVTEKVENVEGKTRLTTSADYRFSGFYKLIQPFARGRLQKEHAKQLDDVKHAIESQAKP
jgi:carbon monoxide dehydrogenase subunit G